MVKTINITFSDEEHAVINEAKGELAWRTWILATARQQIKNKAMENENEYRI